MVAEKREKNLSKPYYDIRQNIIDIFKNIYMVGLYLSIIRCMPEMPGHIAFEEGQVVGRGKYQ